MSIIGACDRTGEFRACAKSYQQRVLAGRASIKFRSSLRPKQATGKAGAEFSLCSEGLSKDLQRTQLKMKKLCIMFNEKDASFTSSTNKLIDVIQCDIVDLNKTLYHLKTLESKTCNEYCSYSQLIKHNSLVVRGLECYLANLVNTFQKVLETNKGKISGIESPNEVHSVPTTFSPVSLQSPVHCSTVSSTGTSLASMTSRIPPNHTMVATGTCISSAVSLSAPENVSLLYTSSQISNSSIKRTTHVPIDQPVCNYNTVPYGQHMNLPASSDVAFHWESPGDPDKQMGSRLTQLQIPLADQEIRQRDATIKRVESTIVQLGEIYQQFSTLVHEQSDIVTRIDSSTDEAEVNVGSAHEHLLLYFRTISSRRAFMLKVFAVVFMCFLLFAWLR
ncbi:hypothetical protein EG68_09774 [Paragonimus skrjabini miyazakii]|uniref:t-SNARE coiled-coil homology domain-containing protein n=1 Tax=Paragonimus skrjabini miyazakii TaxID=59628 RepID=A0A8S9YHJ2_9TREM|nr:hypothetical protein EG68_09774 [Paragonimus skrjabini miyazakii]